VDPSSWFFSKTESGDESAPILFGKMQEQESPDLNFAIFETASKDPESGM